MKKGIIILILMLSFSLNYGQENLISSDGTLSNHALQKMYVESLNKQSSGEVRFDLEKNHLVVISKTDCGDKEYEQQEMQKVVLSMSFIQLVKLINNFKNAGYDPLAAAGFEGMIFKTNIICMLSTRRYHFKFSLQELNNFPHFMDFQELFEYVVVEKKNQNIIYAKNP